MRKPNRMIPQNDSAFLLQNRQGRPINERGLIRQSDTIRIEGTAMNFSHDTITLQLACGFALVGVLTATPAASSTLNSPQRPASLSPVNSSAIYKSRTDHINHDQQTYLAMIGPAPLRFTEGERALPPEPVIPTPAPKQPVNLTASGQKSPLDSSGHAAYPATPSTENTDLNVTLTPSSQKPVTILPDDTRKEIRAEDVLPFFQFPGAPESGAVAVPFSASQPRETTAAPRSSATYQQQ